MSKIGKYIQQMKKSYRETLKSPDTEEWIDLLFYRPVGYMWACLAKMLGITPNAITIASIVLGVAAGVAFYFPDIRINIIGMVLLVWADSFDSADGQLARMTQQYSRLGRILDGMAGDIWFIAIYAAICLRENAATGIFAAYPLLIWGIAAFTGFFHARQASTADYYRQFHLYFLRGGNDELETGSELKSRYDALSWKYNFCQKTIMLFYTSYTRRQEAQTPYMQQLRRELKLRFPDGNIPQSFRDAFRAESLPLMKYTNILTFNWRAIALFAALLIQMPVLYFVFELTVLNIVKVYLVYRHERICRMFVRELENSND